jgi:hypothetical protein
MIWHSPQAHLATEHMAHTSRQGQGPQGEYKCIQVITIGANPAGVQATTAAVVERACDAAWIGSAPAAFAPSCFAASCVPLHRARESLPVEPGQGRDPRQRNFQQRHCGSATIVGVMRKRTSIRGHLEAHPNNQPNRNQVHDDGRWMSRPALHPARHVTGSCKDAITP